ncbi:MAG: hypothetical protein OEV93_00340, partial [Candidatus Moranbacteria bacterium]|nr:hypothetical protein [Candidatus Moranbacteria bacterium]
HDKNLNELELKLTPLMKTRLNEGGGGGDVEYSDELHVMQEQSGVDEYSREMPYYSGNYVISKLSPEAYGIYSKSGILVGYFELEKVESAKNNRTEVEVKEPEKLFREINFENPDQDSFLFKLLLSVPFRDEIKKRLGLDIADLDIKNQYFFLRFIGEKTERDFKKVSEFVKDGKEQKDQLNRVKTFLSLEFGEDISEKLFAISEKLSPEQTDLVFAKYAEIVEMTYDIESEIMGSLKKKEKMGRIDPRMVSKELLLRGRKLLVSFADKIEKAEEGSLSLEEILSHLEDYREDMVFHAAVVKEGKKVGMGYDEFVGNKFEIVTAEELAKDPNVVKQMRDIYERNWAGTPALQASLLRNFDLAVEQGGDNTLFFVLKHVDLKLAQASVEAFCRTDEVSPDKIYFGSLNVRPSIQGAALGRIVKEAALAMEGEHYNLELDSDPFDPKTTTVYIEKDGFVATRAYEYEGEYTFSLAKERQGKDYFFKKMSQADVAEYHMQNNLGNAYNEDDSRMVLFLPIGENETRKLLDELVNKKHFVITRYFFSQDQKSVYCALERGVSSS